MDSNTITIVSGLPRSGTSMLMKMLEAGGLKPLTDRVRTADEDNPKGYYEFERVKKLEKDKAWVPEARGKVVKVISMLLKHLPPGHSYKVLFMIRSMEEVLASQRQMLIRRGEPTDKISDERLAELFGKHLRQTQAWLEAQPGFEVCYLKYREVLDDPAEHCGEINAFLGSGLDEEKMVAVVDPKLYRQRKRGGASRPRP